MKKKLLSSLSKLVCIRANTHTHRNMYKCKKLSMNSDLHQHTQHIISLNARLSPDTYHSVCVRVGGWGLSINMGLMEPSESCSVPSENDLITFAKWMSLEGVFAASGLKHTHTHTLTTRKRSSLSIRVIGRRAGVWILCFICTYLARSVTSLFFITSFWRLLSHSHLLLFKPLKHRLWFFLFFCS